jgi:hypothetical protein
VGKTVESDLQNSGERTHEETSYSMSRPGRNPSINELKLRKLVEQLQGNVLQIATVKGALEKEASQVLEEIYNKVLELDKRMSALERSRNPHEPSEGTTETAPGNGAENLLVSYSGAERGGNQGPDFGEPSEAVTSDNPDAVDSKPSS